jgi:selenocysteine-specific elongation factor
VKLEEQVEILPSGIKTKIRGLHNHGKASKQSYAGQRTAMNLQGVEKDDLHRGDMVITAGRFSTTYAIDARLELLESAVPVKTRSQVHFHLGTSETIARVILYGTDLLKPGESSYCQLRLNDPVVAQSGDRFVIRRLSPLETIGGGSVLDSSPGRRKKKDGIDDLPVLEKGTIEEKISVKVATSALKGMTTFEIEGWISAEVPQTEKAIKALVKNGELLRSDGIVLHKSAFELFSMRLGEVLSEFHKANPTSKGMPKEEARERLKVEQGIFNFLAEEVQDVAIQRDLIALKSFRSAVTDDDKDNVLKALEGRGIEVPQRPELAKELGMEDRPLADVLKLMADEGTVKRVNDAFHISLSAYSGMLDKLRGHYRNNDSMTVAEFRDMMGTSRKFALPILEFLDAANVTVRVGDVRKLLLKD